MRKRLVPLLVLIAVGVGVAILVAPRVGKVFRGEMPLGMAIRSVVPWSREALVEKHLSWADQQCQAAIEKRLRELDAYFEEAKKRTPEFADSAFSLGSKWAYVRGSHRRYLEQRFAEIIFSPADLQATIEQVVTNYLREVESIEGQMLVNLQADLADHEGGGNLGAIDTAAFREAFQRQLAQVLAETQSRVAGDISVDIGHEIVSFIVGELATKLAVSLATSAGILGAGAASSLETFGVGLIVGLGIDYAISKVRPDPKPALVAKLNEELDQVHVLLVEGGSDVVGLRQRLDEFVRQRSQARRQAVLQLLSKTEVENR